MTGETHNLSFGIPYPDTFGPADDEPMLGLYLTRAGMLALGDVDGDDESAAQVVELPCQHPPEARELVHDDLDATDPDQLFFCAVCGDERGWAA